jgi:hypothetical protein
MAHPVLCYRGRGVQYCHLYQHRTVRYNKISLNLSCNVPPLCYKFNMWPYFLNVSSHHVKLSASW